jgi:branched-chain amino acid transport system permease protein
MGINTRNMKLLVFAMGASFGGLSGAMFGAFQGFVSPEYPQIIDAEVIRQLLYGLALVIIMLYRSEGLWPNSEARGQDRETSEAQQQEAGSKRD